MPALAWYKSSIYSSSFNANGDISSTFVGNRYVLDGQTYEQNLGFEGGDIQWSVYQNMLTYKNTAGVYDYMEINNTSFPANSTYYADNVYCYSATSAHRIHQTRIKTGNVSATNLEYFTLLDTITTKFLTVLNTAIVGYPEESALASGWGLYQLRVNGFYNNTNYGYQTCTSNSQPQSYAYILSNFIVPEFQTSPSYGEVLKVRFDRPGEGGGIVMVSEAQMNQSHRYQWGQGYLSTCSKPTYGLLNQTWNQIQGSGGDLNLNGGYAVFGNSVNVCNNVASDAIPVGIQTVIGGGKG